MNRHRCSRSYILLFILVLLPLCSCTDDNRNATVEEGKPATLELSLPTGSFPKETISLKAAIPTAEESKVYNLYVLIFGQDGHIIGRHYFPYDTANDKVAGAVANKVSISTISGQRSVCAIANIGNESPLANISKEQLDGINTRTELDALIVSFKDGVSTISRAAGRLLMSGCKSNITLNPEVTTAITLPLVRVCARVKFTVVAGNTNLKFYPTAWRVLRIPKAVRLMDLSTDKNGVAGDDNYFDTDWKEFETAIKPDGSTEETFTYYQYENKKEPRTTIPGTGDIAYHLREKQDKTPNGDGSVTNAAFKYAAANATYIQIQGEVVIKDGNNLTTANVTYTIHTGYIGKNANDFDCRRNTAYEYKVTINGVNNIMVEAAATNPDNEPNTGAEGSVVMGGITVFDSHYATCIIYLPPEIAGQARPFFVNTPFDKQGTTDIDWLKFYINPKGSNKEMIATFPGESSSLLLNARQLIDRMKTNPGDFATDDSGNYILTCFVNEYYYDKNPMTSGSPVDPSLWKQFVNQPPREMVLGGFYNKSKDGKSSAIGNAIILRQESIKTVYDTQFSDTAAGFEVMDENWGEEYANETGFSRNNTDPADGWQNSTRDWELVNPGDDPRTITWTKGNWQKWKNYVNLNAVVPPNSYGWGTYKLVSARSVWDGTAALTNNKARYACMARNRDLNGDGVVDKEEVRWYQPATDQMLNAWIGASIIPIQYQAYRTPDYYAAFTNPTRPPYVLYLTSTQWDSQRSNPTIFWSKEGSSIGDIFYPVGLLGGRNKFYTRCMRNLGHTDASIQPSPVVTWDGNNNKISMVSSSLNARFDLDNCRNTDADFIRTELAPHNERSPYNKPAKRFKVAKNYLWGGEYFTWNQLRTGTPTKGCKDYYEKSDTSDKGLWRMPNQRELALMSRCNVVGNWGDGTDNTNGVWCATYYSFDDRAFTATNKMIRLGAKTETKRVRCVRDLHTDEN